MALQQDLREFIELLNSKGVEYVVVGAHALAYYGYPRFTGDLDLFVRVSEDNARKLEESVAQFGLGVMGLTATDFLGNDQVIELGVAPNRIDILTALTGVTFDQVWKDKVATSIDGVPVFIIGRAHLIENKRTLGRPKDLADLDYLEKV